MQPLDFLETANKLLTNSDVTEADIRSAVSRSYYAVFLYIRQWWSTSGFRISRSATDHTKIYQALFHADMPGARARGEDLRDLLTNRRKADYDLTEHFNRSKGEEVLQHARRTISAFDAMDKNILKEAVEDYLRLTNQL
jgi:uncharacterized protein (UPF0332 family)